MVWPYLRLGDADAARANGGWRRFLAINYGVGAYISILTIAAIVLPLLFGW